MFSFVYNFSLLLFALASLPKVLLQREKYRNSLPARLGLELPAITKGAGKRLFWIHAVSVGEAKAALPLFERLKKEYPHALVVVSSTTETGHEEAKRSLEGADAYFYLPLDFSWTMRKLVEMLKPDVLFLMEGEFWHNLITEAKKAGASVVLVNGKLSELSRERFSLIPFFTNRVFGGIDHFCVQSAFHQNRFLQLGVPRSKVTITGNIKLDVKQRILTPSEKDYWKEELGLLQNDRIVTIGSTHAGEEVLLLDAMKEVWKELADLKLLLVPRHPERFEEAAALLDARKIPYVTFTGRRLKNRRERVVLIDTMGMLTTCYQLSEAAIVAGSFTGAVGGHNIFEAIQCGIPVLFGPHMQAQRELSSLVLESGAGRQASLQALPHTLLDVLQIGTTRAELLSKGRSLNRYVQGASQRTWSALTPYLCKI